MAFGKRRLLAAFLEKESLKLLVFEISGSSVSRVFGGQVNFTADVLREAFIADPVKFSSQIKAALTVKEEFATAKEVVLVIPAEKTFVKAMPVSDAIDGFVKSLPYFKEELLIDTFVEGKEHKAGESDLVNHVAFEKKLIEDLERPFLENGKKVLTVVSGVQLLASQYTQSGKYFLILPFDRETAAVVCENGVIIDLATFPKEVFVGRLPEFRLGKNYGEVKDTFTLGSFETGILDKLRADQQLNVRELAGGDIYDHVVDAFVQKGVGKTTFDFSVVKNVLEEKQKVLFLIGAAAVGFVLVIVLARNLSNFNLFQKEKPKQAVKNVKTTPTVKEKPVAPAPEPKAADFKVRVLNGTRVAGEAGRAAEKLKESGFEVTETKNATSSGFRASRLRMTVDVSAKIKETIKKVLLETYLSVDEELLTDDTVKIEVIVGTKK